MANAPEKPVSATPDPDELANQSGGVLISREVYEFLMGEGPLEGVWFGDLNDGLPGRFWWRALLRCAAGWPEVAAQADRSPEGQDAKQLDRNDESAVAKGHAPESTSQSGSGVVEEG